MLPEIVTERLAAPLPYQVIQQIEEEIASLNDEYRTRGVDYFISAERKLLNRKKLHEEHAALDAMTPDAAVIEVKRQQAEREANIDQFVSVRRGTEAWETWMARKYGGNWRRKNLTWTDHLCVEPGFGDMGHFYGELVDWTLERICAYILADLTDQEKEQVRNADEFIDWLMEVGEPYLEKWGWLGMTLE